MSEEAETIVCPKCGERRFRTFRHCPRCGASLPAPTATAVDPPPKPPVSRPFPEVGGKISPPPTPTTRLVAPRNPPPTMPAATLRHRLRRSPTIVRIAAGSLVVALLAAALFAFLMGRDGPAKTITVTVGPDRWVDVDPRATFGADREFVVLGRGPLRIRTASGKPILSNGAAPSLGRIDGGGIELKSVGGVQTVTLMLR